MEINRDKREKFIKEYEQAAMPFVNEVNNFQDYVIKLGNESSHELKSKDSHDNFLGATKKAFLVYMIRNFKRVALAFDNKFSKIEQTWDPMLEQIKENDPILYLYLKSISDGESNIQDI